MISISGSLSSNVFSVFVGRPRASNNLECVKLASWRTGTRSSPVPQMR